MAEKLCHKLLNENLKIFCQEDLTNEKDFINESKNAFDATDGCSAKCEELCNGIQERLEKIRDLIHLRSSTPNVILVDTLILIKQHVKEVKKYVEAFNNVIYEEKTAADILENIVDYVNLQNNNIEEMFQMFNQKIVITKNNTQITLKEPKGHGAFSEDFVNHLLKSQKEGNQQRDRNEESQAEEIGHRQKGKYNEKEADEQQEVQTQKEMIK